ncbi:MAG: DNA translocase FtsK 4TM domain-containing protein, partial [Candidatus Doudnabacteria bacterium]|nr:DNA translocase FtsK 4TM domain-containing protein [Candidatus Doudnabacteria bacterium]
MKKTNKERETEKRYKKNKRPKLNLSPETKRGIAVVVFIALAIVTFLSSLSLAGSLGQFILNILKWVFGVLAYFVPIFLLLIAILLSKHKILAKKDEDEDEPKQDGSFYLRVYLGSFLLIGSIAGLVHVFYIKGGILTSMDLASQGKAGGFLGALFGGVPYKFLDIWASIAILGALLIIALLMAFNVSLRKLWPKKNKTAGALVNTEISGSEVNIKSMASQGFIEGKILERNKNLRAEEGDTDLMAKLPAQKMETKIIQGSSSTKSIKLESMKVEDRKDWKLPPFDLLDDTKNEVDSGNIEVNMQIIKKTLADFGIEVEMGEVNVGPTVTQYTLRPATGVKLSQIAALQNDLALALSAHSIRMELPIPGKPLVGIEVPNKSTAIVRLRDVLQTKEYVDHKSKLAFALGRDVAGHPMVADLAKMPHLLIAGATGTGKSVGINSLLISLLFRNTPQEVKFIVIDPKRVELNLYNGIPHLLTPVVTDYEKAVNALKWAVSEMDRRYKLMAEMNKRNIIEYNETSELPMYYIAIVVDELADLMSVA